MAESTETTYNNYYFFENIIIPIDIAKSKSWATSVGDLPKVVNNPDETHDLVTEAVKNILASSTAEEPYYNYYSAIISPEENINLENFEGIFYSAKQEIVLNIDIQEAVQDNPWYGKVNVTIDVLTLRQALESSNKITCKGGSTYQKSVGCAHKTPPEATHITYGTFHPSRLQEVLKPLYGSDKNIPVFERVTPYILAEDTDKLTSFPSSAGSWDGVAVNESMFSGFLPPGVYLSVKPATDVAGSKGFHLADVLSGKQKNQQVFLAPSHIQLVTWASLSSIAKEPKPVKQIVEAEKIIDLPVVDEPPKAATLHASLNATHIVRPTKKNQKTSTIRDLPAAGRSLGKLQKDTAVQVIEQSVGPRLRYHKILIADPVVGFDMMGTEAYIKASHLRPIAAAKTDGSWYLLPTVDQKDADSRTAGSSPLMDKVFEAQDVCTPWVAKDKDAYWNSKYQIVYTEPGTAVGDSKSYIEEHKVKALAQLVEYFDKSKKVDNLAHILALAQHAVVYEDVYRDKLVIKSLVSVPVRFFNALKRNTDPFDYDNEPDLERIRNNASMVNMLNKIVEASSPAEEMRKIINQTSTLTQPKNTHEAYQKVSENVELLDPPTAGPLSKLDLNPSVAGEKVAFTSGFYDSDLTDGIKKIKKIFKYYDRKLKRSKKTVKFPGFSVPLDMKDEEKKIDEWYSNLKGFLKVNSYDFEQVAPREENKPGKYDPKKAWFEFGWNQEFKLLYVLFNGHPLRVGFKCFRMKDAWALARTNAFIHRSPEILKEYKAAARKKEPWSEWVKKNVYPVALIEPSDLTTVNSKKAKLQDAVAKSTETTAKTDEQLVEEEVALQDPEISIEIQSQASKEKIDARDQTFANLPETIEQLKDINDIYDFVVNKLPFQNIILEFTRCIGEDLDANSLIELLIRLALKEIMYEYEKNIKIIEDIFEILEMAPGCALDILKRSFVLVVEESVSDEDDFDLDDFPIPPAFPAPAAPSVDSPPPSPVATHIVGPAGSINIKGVPFLKTLPWNGNQAYGTVNVGQTFIFIENVEVPPDADLYTGAIIPPGLDEIKNKQMVKVSIIDKLANLSPGTVGYIESVFLETVDEALGAQEAEKQQSVILKKGAKDGKKGLLNEVKALESYLSSAPQGSAPPSDTTTEVIGKYHGRPLLEKCLPKPKNLTAKLKSAAKLKGSFTWSTKVLVKALGKQLVKEYETPGAKVLFSLKSAEKMKTSGEITLAAMEKIKTAYASSLSAVAEGHRLEEVEERLAFNSPEVILGNALFAPPGFYEGKESSCSEKYVKLVNKKREYEISFIKQGPAGKKTVKLKLETEKLFGSYRSCMSALGDDAYGNNISHLYGRDISAEEQHAKDGYKIVFAKEQGECKDLKDALHQQLAKTGDEDWYPGTAAATPDQRAAYDAWIDCVNKKSAEETKKTLEEEKRIMKAGITSATHITAEYSYPTTIDEAYNLFITQGVMPTGLRPKKGAGLSIADAILGPSGPCASLRDVLIDHLIALILREYPEIEMTVRMTLLAYKRSLELYALVRSIDPQNPFGLPKFPKLPTDMADKAIAKKFAEALDKVIEEILFNMMEGLIQALHEICQLINTGKNLKEGDLQEAAQDVLDNFLNHPESARVLQDAADKMGLDLVPSVVNNQVVMPRKSAGNGQPSLYQFISDILEDLTREEICSIINESYSRTLFNNVKESIIISYPQYHSLLIKDSTIKAIFAGIAAMMPPSFCLEDTGGMDGEDGSILCLADVVDDKERKQFMNRGLDRDDVDGLIARKRKRQMDRLVDLAGIMANPQDRLEESLPDFCSDINDTLFADPGFVSGLNIAVDSNLKLIREVFNTDVASFTQRLLRMPSVTINNVKLQDNFKKLMGGKNVDELDPNDGAAGQALLRTLEEDPAAFIEEVASMAAEDPDNVDQGVAQMAKYLEVEDAWGIYMEDEDRLLRFKDLNNFPSTLKILGYEVSSIYNAQTKQHDKTTIIDLLNMIAVPLTDFVAQISPSNPFATPKFTIPNKFGSDGVSVTPAWTQAMGRVYATAIINSLGSFSENSIIKTKSEDSLMRLIDLIFADPDDIKEVTDAITSISANISGLESQLHSGLTTSEENDLKDQINELKGTLNGEGALGKWKEMVGNTLTNSGPGGTGAFYAYKYLLHLRAPYETSSRKHKVTDFNSINKSFGATPGGLAGSNIIVGQLKSALLNAQENSTIQINDSGASNAPIQINLFAPESLLPRFSAATTPMLTFEMPQTDQYLDHYKVSVTSTPAQTSMNPERFIVDSVTGNMIDATKLPPSDPEYKNPSEFPETKTAIPAEKKEYTESYDLPLYVQNFIDYVSSGEDLSFAGLDAHGANKKHNFAPAQLSLFVGFLNKKFDELFPNKPENMKSLVSDDSDYVTSVAARALYNDMIRTSFEGSLRSIGKSKYFLKSELSKLNLNPEPPDCPDENEAPDPSFSLLDIKGIKKYINDAYKNDFNSCDSQEPEALEAIIAEATVLLFIRVVILEAALNGIFAFGTFDLRDLTKDSFIQKYLFDRAKTDLRQVFQYKSFKNTATKILERRRKQYKKFVKIRSPKDSLAILFKEEAEAVMPVYEKILGSTVKEYNDIIFEDIIFPVPVDVANIVGSATAITSRYDKPIGQGGLTPDIDTGKIRKYFGVASQIKVDAFSEAGYDKTDTITLASGKQVNIVSAGNITLGEIFSHKSGFIIEKYVKFKESAEKTLTNAIEAVNSAAKDEDFLPLPPSGHQTSIDDFFGWLRYLLNAVGEVIEEGTQDLDVAIAVTSLKDILESSWSGFLDSCDFGMRIKYIIAADTSQENSNFGDSAFQSAAVSSFKNKVEEYMIDFHAHHNSGAGDPAYGIPSLPVQKPPLSSGIWDPNAPLVSDLAGNWLGRTAQWNKLYRLPSAYRERNKVIVRGRAFGEGGQGPLSAAKDFYEIPLVETSISLHSMPNITNSTSDTDSAPGLGWSTSLQGLYDNIKDYKLGSAKSAISPYKNDYGYNFPQAHVVYDGFFSNVLKKKLQNSGNFKAIFEYMIPMRRIVNASSVFSLETLEKSFDLDNLFSSTKFAVALIHAQMKNAGKEGPGAQAASGEHDALATDEFSMEDKIAEIILGFLLKSLAEAPLLIIKGVAEIADPNIAITKKIFDGMDLTVKAAMLFVLNSLNLAMREYNTVARNINQEVESVALEAGLEITEDLAGLMPVYDTVNDFMVQELGLDPKIDPTVGIPSPIAAGIAPAIALSMLPSMLPFGVGFPPPPFGPGIGPPMTPLGIPYLVLGLIKEGGWNYETFEEPKSSNPGQAKNICNDGSSFQQKPNLEDDDD